MNNTIFETVKKTIFRFDKGEAYFLFSLNNNAMRYYSKKAGKKVNDEFTYIAGNDLIKFCRRKNLSNEAIECLYLAFLFDLSMYDYNNIICALLKNCGTVTIEAFKKTAKLIREYYYRKNFGRNIYRIILKYA